MMIHSNWRTATLIVVSLVVLGVSALSGAAPVKGGSMGSGDSSYIDIEMYVAVNGGEWFDADSAPGPEIPDGGYVEFLFVVTNLAPDSPLTNIAITHSVFEVSGCPIPPWMFPGQSLECVIGPFDCMEGQNTTIGIATGMIYGEMQTDTDAANFYGLCGGGGGGGGEQPGTGSPGYWKNHPEAWPVDEIIVGGMIYTRNEAIEVMRTPGRRDKTFTMFRSLVAGVLNVMIGNDPSCIEEVIVEADDWMSLYPAGSGVRAKSDAWQENEWLHHTLSEYNRGELCAPPRE